MPDLPWTPYTPYIIYGYIRTKNSSTTTVTATNRTTNESQSVTSETDSSYLIDTANFANGYTDLDTIDLISNNNRESTSINIVKYPYGRQINIIPKTYNRKKY